MYSEFGVGVGYVIFENASVEIGFFGGNIFWGIGMSKRPLPDVLLVPLMIAVFFFITFTSFFVSYHHTAILMRLGYD